MKVLMINGSPHKEGNTYIALKEMEKIFSAEGIESEIIQVGINRSEAVTGAVSVRKKDAVSSETVSMRSRRYLKNATVLSLAVRSTTHPLMVR